MALSKRRLSGYANISHNSQLSRVVLLVLKKKIKINAASIPGLVPVIKF